MTCTICEANTEPYFTAMVIRKYRVYYFRCTQCNFIQTETPYWLEEAYKSAISWLDVGLIQRNINLAPISETLLRKWFDVSGRFLDYGGGYGMFVRMMRDRGFDFYRQDAYCTNLFAKYFDVSDLNETEKFDVVTAFEVFEHLPNPVNEVERMLTLGDAILFSTEVQPFADVKPETWWYFMLDAGQHVSLYSRSSLQALANRFSLYYNYNDNDLHLFSRHKINNKLFSLLTRPRNSRIYNKIYGHSTSLMTPDFEYMQRVVRTELDKNISQNKL